MTGKRISRNTKTITFSLLPELAEQIQGVMREEGCTMSELIREALRNYMEERGWLRPVRLREAERTWGGAERDKEMRRMNMRLQDGYVPAALCARVSSDRQDMDLSVATWLRALRDYVDRNGYLVVREYVDEAESGRIADRPEFRRIRMLDEVSESEAPF